MRLLLVLTLIGGSAIAQTARESTATILNLSRVAATDFQVGDRFEIVISGAAKQPVSVKTTMQGRTDWGPVIGWTGSDGRWSHEGQFEKSDFGDWREVWTVGDKQVSSPIQFSLGAACPPGVRSGMTAMGSTEYFSAEVRRSRRHRMAMFFIPPTAEQFRGACI